MVGNDGRYPARFDVLDLLFVADAAVYRNDERGGMLVYELLQRRLVHAVALRAFGDIRRAMHAELPERGNKYGGSAHAVCVVIAEHDDGIPPVFRFGKRRGKLLHSAHQKRRKKMLFRRRKKARGVFGRFYPPRKQDPCGKLAYAAGGREPFCAVLLFFGEHALLCNLFHTVPNRGRFPPRR